MNYTLEHLRIAHNAGSKKFPFDKILELITLLERNGLSELMGTATTSRRGRPSVIGAKQAKLEKSSRRRAPLGTKILGFLQGKGLAGAHVGEIAKAIKAPQASVAVWFHTTGKKALKTGEITKVSRATYAHRKEKSEK